MEEKKYPVIEEEDGYGVMTAAEPVAAYAMKRTTAPRIPNISEEAERAIADADRLDSIPPGLFGFYTDDPEVFEQRVAEIEADMDEVDAGVEDPEKWVEVDDLWATLKRNHPWL